MKIKGFFCALILGLAGSLPGENLLQNPEFKPAIYEGKPHGALSWRFWDWTRRSRNIKNQAPYYTGEDLYKFSFGKNSFSMKVHNDAPLKEVRLTLEDNGTLFLPPAPKFRLSGEYLMTGGKLAMRVAARGYVTLPSAPQWKKLDRLIPNKEWINTPLQFRYTLPREATFGLRDLKLEAVYPASTGKILLPGGEELKKIVIGKKAAYKELIAAEFWRGVLWKITGNAPRIVRSDKISKGALILRTVPKKGVMDGTYSIKLNKEYFLIEAQNLDAHWAALWNYARKLGVRIYSAERRFFPKKKILHLAALDRTFTPRFSTVYGHNPNDQIGIASTFNGGVTMQSFLAFADDWYGMYQPHGFHNLQGFLPYSFDKHPEFYPMNREGKRVFHRTMPQLCYSNNESPKLIARRFRIWVKNYPETLDYLFQQHDGVEVCQCAPCKKRMRSPGENTDNTVLFLNKLADNVPEARIGTLAYTVLTKDPPSPGMKASPNTLYQYCTRFNDWKCPLHVDCILNKKGIEQVKGWAKFLGNDKKRLQFYLYDGDFVIDSLPGQLLELLNKYGNRNVFLCNNNQMASYAVARWNWGEDYWEAVKDYMRGIYRKAAPAMMEASLYLSRRAANYKHTQKDLAAGKAAFFPYLFSSPQSCLDRSGFEKLISFYNKALSLEKDPIARCYILDRKNEALMSYIARYPRSSCRNKKEIDAFVKLLNIFIDSNAELFNLPHPLARKWPYMWRKMAMNSLTPEEFFARYTGIDLKKGNKKGMPNAFRRGSDWTKCPAILAFKKDPSSFMIRMPKTVYNHITGYQGSGAVFWDAGALSGGIGESLIRYQCPPRQAVVARRPSSGQHVITGEFFLRKAPKKEQLLFVTGQDSDKKIVADWLLEVNNKTIARGKVPFVKSDWNTALYRIPASYLVQGMNIIKITNTTPEPKSGARSSVTDQGGTFMGEGHVSYQHGWLAVNSVMICEYKGGDQGILPKKRNHFKNYVSLALPVLLEKDKTYTVRGELKTLHPLRFRVTRLNMEGKEHSAPYCEFLPDSATQLHFACKKGDKYICVKDASQWKKGPYSASFNLQNGYAKAFHGTIRSITKMKDHWRVDFYKPLAIDRHAGLSVACGIYKSNGKFFAFSAVAGKGDYRKFEFNFKGSDPALCKPGTGFFNIAVFGKDFSLRNVTISH